MYKLTLKLNGVTRIVKVFASCAEEVIELCQKGGEKFRGELVNVEFFPVKEYY